MEIVQLEPEKYRLLVAVQYLNASTMLYEGLKRQQGTNNFHFLVTVRSFIEYTRRGIWFLAWATEEQVHAAKELTFDKSGSPGLVGMDTMMNEAMGLGSVCAFMAPVAGINNEPFLNCLHALTHGNPISVRMLTFGIDEMFKTDALLIRAEADLNLFRILLYRRMLGQELNNIWKMLGTIHDKPELIRTNVLIAAHLIKQAGLTIETLKEPDALV
jgi:hypothetical protein